MRSSCSIVCAALFLAAPLLAEGEPSVKAKSAEYEIRPASYSGITNPSSRARSSVIDGTSVSYAARAGNMVLRAEDGEPRGSIIYVVYMRDGADDVADRPIT